MNLVEEIIRIVRERDRLASQLDSVRRMYDGLTEYCQAQDADFMKNWRRWSDSRAASISTWDWQKLVERAALPLEESRWEPGTKVEFGGEGENG